MENRRVKNRILLTLGLLLVYRFGASNPSGIDATKLTNLTNQTDEGIGWLINVFTGGAFSQASVFALGIMPYISASIVVQLMELRYHIYKNYKKMVKVVERKLTKLQDG